MWELEGDKGFFVCKPLNAKLLLDTANTYIGSENSENTNTHLVEVDYEACQKAPLAKMKGGR
jgi:hypothetical protein